MNVSKERNEDMKSILSNIKVPYTRIEGVDGRSSTVRDLFSANYEISMSNSDIGCTLSHIKAINYASKLEGEYIMICEDDIRLDNIVYFREDLKSIIEGMPKDCEILLLNKTYRGEIKEKYGLREDYERKGGIWGIVCYIIRGSVARRLSEGMKYIEGINRYKIGSMNISEMMILRKAKVYVYKYDYINTENEIMSTIHESHRGLHKSSSEYQLKEILKMRY